MKLEKTFFDYLLISSSEIIHSKTIAWIFSLPEDVLSTTVKEKVLRNLFDVDIYLDGIYSETEINKLDIFIDSKDCQIIIENKLKSSEHSNQTHKYNVNNIPQEFNPKEKTQYFGFLTLVEEKPENPNWASISYERLLESLKIIELEDNKEHLLIKDYIALLNNLVSVYKDFNKNHQQYRNVFTDGEKKKYEKREKLNNLFQDYIRRNDLETVFQKVFLREILNYSRMSDFGIGESHGNALAQVDICSFEYGGCVYNIGMQFQGKTLKINLVDVKYNKSKKEEIEEKLKPAFIKVFHNKNGYDKINPPKTKAYISVSKQLEKELYELEKEEIAQMLNKEYKLIEEKVEIFNKEMGGNCIKKQEIMKASGDIDTKNSERDRQNKSVKKIIETFKEKFQRQKNKTDKAKPMSEEEQKKKVSREKDKTRKDWEEETSGDSLKMVEDIFKKLGKITAGYSLYYGPPRWIGLTFDSNIKNIISFIPFKKKDIVKMTFDIEETKQTDKQIEYSGLGFNKWSYNNNKNSKRYELKIDKTDLSSNFKIIKTLTKKAKQKRDNKNKK